jgi:ABC-type Zn uptake system ZnuABC Zn-binding protein ZnuA/ABC-type Mn2+/Zn2+ transport system permease subunit
VLEPFSLPFVQRGLLEVLFLSVGAGLLGTWIVLRGLAFYSHAVAAAAFPGLVLADGLSFSAPLGGFAVAALFAAGVGRLSASRRADYDSLTALALVGALAGGVILASDVFHSGANVETLLFGSLLLIGTSDIVLAAAVSALALAATLTLGRRWLATGFDRESAHALGVRSSLTDLVLLALVALAAVASLSAVGALLASALLVIPAATTRLWTQRLGRWQLATVGLVALEGTVGLWLSVETNVPPGAGIAVLAGGVFALAAILRVVRLRPGRRAALAATAALLLLVGGCGSSGGGDGRRVKVVATTTEIGDFVRTVGGKYVDVHQILSPNTDPHAYEPRPRDVTATADAKLVFVSGNNLDSWMSKVVREAGGSPRVIDLSKSNGSRVRGERSGPDASKYDPHWWHDPANARAAIAAVGSALSLADPKHAVAYRARVAAYEMRLRRLDTRIRLCLALAPPAQRKLVTSHDAFNYFAKRYGVKVVGAIIPSQTTQGQPSAGDIAALAKQVRAEHVRAIFLESSVNPKLAESVARQTGVIAKLTLYGDTLGPKGSSGSTYVRMEQHNADAMLRGFTGGQRNCSVQILEPRT